MYKNVVRFSISFGIFICLFFFSVSGARAQVTDSVPVGLDLTKYVFQDTARKNVSFSDFKGKYILLDIWASWCRPCINEFPYFDSLKTVFKENKIAFIQLSCDQRDWRWKGAVSMYKRTGIQWILSDDRQFMRDLRVAFIPRYLLIGPDGKLINGYMPKSSDPMVKNMLSQLKGI